ncbi:cellulose binding domain-containing protein [Dyadobacter pollutisoli]|uniref:Alginate lyase family protein n=1 Tax=Dyadobacter pollutisoli TaxID=2910158 RepID=A0A9E8NDZ5_9BACT|nr:cellulose binding domain-containing protein [Dyadobacter pollutisoli]WAC15004.1 alginate lyase family protein [Dyadobacter pollutisoli]
MKTKVTAGEHPWIDSWNKLITDPQAQNTYTPAARANMGSSRQRADADAHAAYLNALRWYISGDSTYAECAVRICNAWSSTVNQVPTGTDIPGLSGIPIFDFGMAAELLRVYPGWAAADFDRFKNMMVTHFYPVAHNFLVNHNGSCISNYWSNWDIANIGAILTMGVLCDDRAKFDEAVDYFKNGAGMGSIMNAVPFVHPGNLGQWQESGRDQEHAQLAVGMLASVCEVAWNQGLDLYSYDNSRLLAGAEYVARTNLSLPVPYSAYNNCQNANQLWVSINGMGRLDDRPVWEMIYNHYVVRMGLNAPNVKAMAQLIRPEHGSADHFGYGTLAFTQNAAASPYPPSPVPSVPAGLTATASTGRVFLKWTVANDATTQGYNVLRSTASGGPYTSIASWTDNTYPQYTDGSVANGTTYYYTISANNQSGNSGNSAEASATPMGSGALPDGWARQDVGTVSADGSASYANVSEGTFVVSGSGSGIGGNSDSFGYTYGIVTGDFTMTARLSAVGGTLSKTGIVFRESLAPDAKALVMKLGDAGWRQAGFGTRSATGGSMTWVGGNDYTWVPAWFRIQRSGNTFTAYQSSDGVTWFTVGTSTVAMADSYYVGLASCSGSTTGALANSTFDNVTMAGGGSTTLAAPAGLTAQPGNTQVPLSWNAVSGAASYSVKRATVSGGPYVTVATGLTAVNYTDTGLSNGTTYYYVVVATNFAGESPNSLEVNVAPVLSLAPVPVGVTATSVSASQVNLSWTASLGAATYHVKRATVSGGPYTTIASPATAGYNDAGLTASTTYYYVITAVNAIGESANSVQVSAAPGQVAYWKFDETSGSTAADSWSGKTGTLASGATLAAGNVSNAVSLDGTAAGYVTFPAGLMSSINDFSVATWVKLDASANWARLFDFGSGTTNYMFLTPRNGANGTLRYAILAGSGEQVINSSSVIATGVWTHIAVTQSGTVGILYVNGVEVGRNANLTLKPSSLGNTSQNWIGKSQFADPLLAGKIDEFQIYNRALSASEVSSLVVLSTRPAAPAPLSVTAGNNQVTLNWTASTGATSYNVKRSTSLAGPYAVIASVTTTSYIDAGADNCVTYFYTVSAANNIGEGANTAPASLSFGSKLSGTLIGTSGSFGNVAATTKAAAIDGDPATFFDAPQASAWVGYDLGSNAPRAITRVRYAPRSAYAVRMVGGIFQGANAADFSDAVALFTISTAPVTGVLTDQMVSNSTPFRYVRYLAPATGYGNVAEIEFWGLDAQVPQIISATASQQIEFGTAFNYTIEATNRPDQFSATGLPDGLNVNACTGIITGTATVGGTFSIALSAGNAWGAAKDTLVLVIKQNQTITFNALTQKVLGDAGFALTATASSALPVSYTSSDTTVATIVNAQIYIRAAGTSTITASQAGNGTYSAAGPVTQLLTVLPFNLKVQYQNADVSQPANNVVKPYMKIVNEGPVAVAYNELTARYWFTAENYAVINTWIDYAQLGNSKVKMKYVPLDLPRNGAYGYIEYSFDASAGNLAVNGNSGPVQSRFANADWSILNEPDDYSYNAIATYQLNDHITLYRNGMLVYGTEPAAAAPVVALKVFSANKSTGVSANSISTYLKINNEGNVPVNYADVKVRYWFTKEGTASLNYFIDYAKLGNSNVSGQFVTLNPMLNGADTYLELGINPVVGTLYPAGSTGNIQYRIAKTDWSAFDHANDYSYKTEGDFVENNHIGVYYQGVLIYGTEPAAANGRLSAEIVAPESTAFQVTSLGNPVTDGQAVVEIQGAKGQSLQMTMIDMDGRELMKQDLEIKSNLERHSFKLYRQASGTYLLRIAGKEKAVTIKLIKQ